MCPPRHIYGKLNEKKKIVLGPYLNIPLIKRLALFNSTLNAVLENFLF